MATLDEYKKVRIDMSTVLFREKSTIKSKHAARRSLLVKTSSGVNHHLLIKSEADEVG